ncbi:DUF2512 family protein [Paenibacillus harenae]|uniref:Membrane protein implicated in regulation of membrane protease activity n=1 Tax=Paenibacillus harenae TaxID=306543 RepID=A0ABT9UCN3_PAEHA|nr:DUF2512 family protein [Paenibacillus harenae]MDQ0116204.1 membrane protein implicated in regulation of membrane protease activity [Paenibacillus harenae]
MIKFLLKWLINGAIVVAFLTYYADATFWNAAIAATALTVIAYLVGDQFILRTTNNLFATICDFLLAVVYFGALSYVFDWELSWGETFFLAVLIGVAEWVFHRYVFNEELRVSG